ncbi:MAG: zinc/manganese transport system substrate-binding protein [Acetobacteraceae bacterium]|jgi:zinc/manganese transport system substrate-binding protein|nr:zinc/manganese transport system substrate-binding protein [Acetobacteraceae bacterium]
MHRHAMRRRSLIAALGLAPIMARAAPRLRVVASFSILADLTRQVGGDAVSVEALVGPDGDVHVYDPRPKDLRTLMAASVLVRNGLGLEGWMDRLTAAAGFKGKVVFAAERVTARTMKQDSGAIATDPHAWQNPQNAVLYVQAIADRLASADPARASAYNDAASRYAARIAQTDAWIEAKLASIAPVQRRIITTHDAFGYYGARYGVEFLSAEGISTESEPSARQIAALVAQIKREKVRAVFVENMTSPRMAQMLARETGAVLGGTVYSDALSPPSGPAASYLEMLRHNTTLFAAAMSGMPVE